MTTPVRPRRSRRGAVVLAGLLVLVHVCWPPESSCADGALRGRVVDERGEPIAGARVELRSSSDEALAETTTSDAGRFDFGSISLDRVEGIRVTREGFLSADIKPLARTDGILGIRLLASRIVDRVVVTAVRSERTMFDIPQSTSVVTSSDMREAAIMTVPGALDGEAGVEVQRTNLGGGSPILRGLVGNQVLVLVDGIRLNNSTFRLGPNHYLNTVSPFGTDRVEIVRGPASSLYGSDGLGGVVAVFTEDVSTTGQTEFSSGYDTATDAPLGVVKTSGGHGRLGYLAVVSAANFGDLEGGGRTGVQSPNGYQRRTGDLKLTLDLKDRGKLLVAGQYFQDEDVPRFDRIAAGRDLVNVMDPQRRTLGYVRYQKNLHVAGDPSFAATLSRMEQTEGRRIVPTGASSETVERDEVTTHGLGVQWTWPEHRRQEWLAGVEFYGDDVESERVRRDLDTGDATQEPGRFPDGARYLSAAAYSQATVHAASRLDLVLGARYGRFRSRAFIEALDLPHRSAFGDLTGSTLFLFRLTPRLHLSGGVSQGFRAPNLDDTTIFGHFNAGVEVPSPDLTPEYLVNYELSLKVLASRIWMSLTVYDSHLRDLIVRSAGTFLGSPTYQGEDVFQRRNLDRAQITGGELDFRAWPLERLLISFSLAQTRGTNSASGEPLTRMPPLSGRLGLRLLLLSSKNAWVESITDFADRQDRLSATDRADTRIPAGGTPGYGVVGLGFGFGKPGGWQANLALHNLGDLDYRVHGSGINGPGRSLRVLIRREFRGRAL